MGALCVGVQRVWGALAKCPLPPVDLGFIESRLRVFRRFEWTDIAARPWRLRSAGSYDRLTIHHAGNTTNYHCAKSAVARDLNGILAAHMARDYGDIGYHFMIDYAGRVWEGRSLAYEGAHVAWQNERNVAVMLLGNFEKQTPSREQLDSLKKIIAALRRRFRIKRHRIYGHRDLGPSVCPGRNLYPHVLRLKC